MNTDQSKNKIPAHIPVEQMKRWEGGGGGGGGGGGWVGWCNISLY